MGDGMAAGPQADVGEVPAGRSAAGDVTPITLDPRYESLRSATVSPSGAQAITYGTKRGGNPDAWGVTVWDLRPVARRETFSFECESLLARFTEDETAVMVALRLRDEVTITRVTTAGSTEVARIIGAGVAMSRDSRMVIVRTKGERVVAVNTLTGGRQDPIPGGGWSPSAGASAYSKVAVSARGERLAAFAPGKITICDLSVDGRPAPVSIPMQAPLATMDCSVGLVVAAWGDTARLVHPGTVPREVWTAPGEIRRVALSGDGTMLAVAYDGGLAIVGLGERSGERWQQAMTSYVTRLTFRLDDQVLVTAHEDNLVRLWDLASLPELTGLTDDRSRHAAWQPDDPASADLLDRRPLARALAIQLGRFADDRAAGSFLVHVDGPWGAGKTTLLDLLRDELGEDWLVIRFNAWRQSKVGTPWWALLAAFRRDLLRGRALPVRAWARVTEANARIRRTGGPFGLALLALCLIAAGLFFLLRPGKLTFASAPNIAQATTALITALATLWAGSRVVGRFFLWDSARGARLYEQSSTSPMDGIAEHFSWLIGKARRPVAFFIDDLDRCPDSYVVDLLETVQTLVRESARAGRGAAPCFVVAADGAWIRQSYETAYSTFSAIVGQPGQPLGYLFLDKLFQLRVTVPGVNAARRDTYLRHLLGAGAPQPQPSPDPQLSPSLARVKQSRSEEEVLDAVDLAPAGSLPQVTAAAVERLLSPEIAADTEHQLQQYACLLPPSPRAMKRFINEYSILRVVRALEGSFIRTTPLALWSLISVRWPSFADYLRSSPEAISLASPPGDRDGGNDQSPAPEILASLPAEFLELLSNPDLRAIVHFHPGSPLTPQQVAQCCGI